MGEAAEELRYETFEDVYNAVMETERGRWFVEELSKRNRSADTSVILDRLQQMQNAEEESRMNVLRGELGDLADTIAKTRDEIAAIKPKDAGASNSADRIEAATGELDAIVSATEQATSDILSAAENLQTLADEMRGAGVDGAFCEPLETESINILMACSFQDITGQRTSKVVNTLRYLEQRVNAMVQIWGTQAGPGPAPSIAADRYNPDDQRPDAHLLHGPAIDGSGVDQSTIDEMLNGELPDLDDLMVVQEEAKPAPAPAKAAAPAAVEAAAEPPAEADEAAGVQISQDDIDSLFD